MQSHPDLFHDLFLSVIPEPIVNPMSYQLQWGLGAKCILGWHVQVIQKCQQLLATKRDINTCKGLTTVRLPELRKESSVTQAIIAMHGLLIKGTCP